MEQHKSTIGAMGPTPVQRFEDRQHPCVYIRGETASMPMVYPLSKLQPDEFDMYLARGRRRSGRFLYHTACPACSACEPTRIPVESFQRSSSLNRVLHRGDRDLRTEVNAPLMDAVRLDLFNRHRMERDLHEQSGLYSASDYESFLVATCCETLEISFWHDNRLIGCSIMDCGEESVSAVYTYFDPAYSRYSPGTYAILKQLEYAVRSHRKYLYLGLFVESNRHLRYKGRFTPQERLIQGEWKRIEHSIDTSSPTS